MNVRVLLVDDHTLFRDGLTSLLERRGIEVAAALGDGGECLGLIRELEPDVVLLDMRMPKIDGLQILHQLREQDLQMPVVMLTTSNSEHDVADCLRAGARGYLLKDMDPDELVHALRDVVAGKTVVAPELAPVLARVVQGHELFPRPEPFNELTPRELEILALLAEGQSNKAIARNLGISDGTVKLHVKAILRKLGVHSRVEAAVLAVENEIAKGLQDRSAVREETS